MYRDAMRLCLLQDQAPIGSPVSVSLPVQADWFEQTALQGSRGGRSLSYSHRPWTFSPDAAALKVIQGEATSPLQAVSASV
ncbi:hypothetical protein N7540_006199 [Penicillium herquei]|nr:hypothetical protein N7540_006199 [Penicillium herquei]